jgi:ADP-ribosylglycohydrolase
MMGSIAGDVMGSRFESFPVKTTEFERFGERSIFTDDTVLTVAVADAILHGGDYAAALRRYGMRHPNRGFGSNFYVWMHNEAAGPYQSWGNGSAMRVAPVGFAFQSEAEVLCEAERSAAVTHDHPEGIKGAQAVALAVFLGRNGAGKDAIRSEIVGRFGYDLGRTLEQIRPHYCFDISCQGSVPEAIIAFLESDSVEDAIRKAISLGGDSDTMGCIAGGISQAFYGGVPRELATEVRGYLTQDLVEVVDEFSARFGC